MISYAYNVVLNVKFVNIVKIIAQNVVPTGKALHNANVLLVILILVTVIHVWSSNKTNKIIIIHNYIKSKNKSINNKKKRYQTLSRNPPKLRVAQ